ncbi:MAG: hypothetical protein M5U01_24140 [Ardenticatenaceae bacterium]|nr:hypothetical protein [Ardenticatenaceae bacterium]HBY95340.1 phosphoenolpyruvate synthase [Chloroflexota bacterium]
MKTPAIPIVAHFGEFETGTLLAGGKGASLNAMTRAGLPVPPGFVVGAEAFRRFLDVEGAEATILNLLDVCDVDDAEMLERVSRRITELILTRAMPGDLAVTVGTAYRALSPDGRPCPVAVRSSAIAEDSEAASFAGQQETYLNICDEAGVLHHIRACWASFFRPRAIFYRAKKHTLADLRIAVVIQHMVSPEKSGVMFTADPVRRRRDQMIVEATWGLGEAVVSGLVTPDNYTVRKRDGAVVTCFVPRKPVAIVRDEQHSGVYETTLDDEQAQARVLSDEELQQLAGLGRQLEAHFGKPQDVEWAIEAGRIYLLQSRPITTL